MKANVTYELIPLLETKPPTEPITDAEKAFIRDFYAITKETDALEPQLVRVNRREIMLYHKGQKELGFAAFRIETSLTMDSTSEEIYAEIQRFRKAFYKAVSMRAYTHRLMKCSPLDVISQEMYAEIQRFRKASYKVVSIQTYQHRLRKYPSLDIVMDTDFPNMPPPQNAED